MTCEITFLPVGNADSIVIQTDISTIIVDLGKLDVLESWLQEHEISRIHRIYITHAHSDHFPSLIRLKDFITDWQEIISIDKIHLPYKVFEIARKKVSSDKNNDPKIGKLRLALKSISEWEKRRKPKFSNIARDGEEYSDGLLKIEALHPSQYYVENHSALIAGKLNEISTVLRVSYSKFSAFLLADIEGAGLTELLSFLNMNSEGNNFTANIVKIPHHGAYPKNGDDLRELLALIDPELAVLSVGSTNRYGHVEPELFKALICLKDNKHKRLEQFICTEVTRTCKHSASDRSTMEKSGLSPSEADKCAGEITIVAETSGTWKLKTEIDPHKTQVASFKCAACDGRGDFG
jgi:beta-lactamase superfamily II metal-dependent hydrolase